MTKLINTSFSVIELYARSSRGYPKRRLNKDIAGLSQEQKLVTNKGTHLCMNGYHDTNFIPRPTHINDS